MLTKAFEMKKEFPFPLRDGKLFLDKRTLVPTNMNTAMVIEKDAAQVIRPGFKNDITLFGITHVEHGMHIVVVSDGYQTRYYWFSQRRQYTYLVDVGSVDLDAAWFNLFKSIITNTKKKTISMYPILRDFAMEYFRTLGEKEINLTLSILHEGKLLYVEVIKESFMRTAMTLAVDGKRRTVDFTKHPLLEVLEA